MASKSHPDRVAATLANVADSTACRTGPFAEPGPGAADCRIDLKLLQWRALATAERSPRAREHLATFAEAAHPDLWAGTVQDGMARGFAVRLEEAIALAPPPVVPGAATPAPTAARVSTGRELKKRRDLLVASGGARVRFTRKEGILFVDRGERVHAANCVRFEARRDCGTLDGFMPHNDERPRLFSAQFLQPQRYTDAPGFQELVLAGRLGRGPIGWSCELVLTGRADEATVGMQLRLDNRMPDHRLRVRFLGVPTAMIAHECRDVRELVDSDAGGFVAFTLVRANDTLLVDGAPIRVPLARCLGSIEHHFRLGSTDAG